MNSDIYKNQFENKFAGDGNYWFQNLPTDENVNKAKLATKQPTSLVYAIKKKKKKQKKKNKTKKSLLKPINI